MRFEAVNSIDYEEYYLLGYADVLEQHTTSIFMAIV
jgi:hypothetical protein